jgi:hypothetical protein
MHTKISRAEKAVEEAVGAGGQTVAGFVKDMVDESMKEDEGRLLSIAHVFTPPRLQG